ncbi:MAG: hypothetical protein ACLQUZ_04430 [Rhizomicrobium sp.]
MEKRTFVCRNCGSLCPILVTLDGDRVLKVEGDFDAPLYRGYSCPKGRVIPQEHHNPRRLLHSLKRLPDGSRAPISSEHLVEEIAERLCSLVHFVGKKNLQRQYPRASRMCCLKQVRYRRRTDAVEMLHGRSRNRNAHSRARHRGRLGNAYESGQTLR